MRRSLSKALQGIIVAAVLSASVFAALIPPAFSNAVVALGAMQLSIVPGQAPTLRWSTEGTGFLYGYRIPEPTKNSYEIYLVTNRHVIEEHEAAGDGVFVLGFPMNLAGIQRNYVIVRQGCVARISEMLDSASPSYLVDALIFPGNSGGPVILRPDTISIQGTPAQTHAFLVSIVRGYVAYRDVAISSQTKRERIAFEENSGLAEVLPTDYIDETIKAHRDSQK